MITCPIFMPDPTNRERQRRWRERRAGRLPAVEVLHCAACGKPRLGKYGELCSRCWERLTPEGRRAKADRVARSRARKRKEM